jgi:hypothetical protein
VYLIFVHACDFGIGKVNGIKAVFTTFDEVVAMVFDEIVAADELEIAAALENIAFNDDDDYFIKILNDPDEYEMSQVFQLWARNWGRIRATCESSEISPDKCR